MRNFMARNSGGVTMLCAVLLVGCSGGDEPSVGKIRFETSVPADQVSLLSEDLTLLKTEGLIAPSDAMLEQMAPSDGSPSSLFAFVENNIQYVLPEGFDKRSVLKIKDSNYTYENADKFPPVVTKDPVEEPTTTGQTARRDPTIVMKNYGTGLYSIGKPAKILYSVQVNEREIDVTSPMVGLIQIGSGLFLPLEVGIDLRSNASRAFRLDTLFHEIWHNYGNAFHAGFLHVICPPGHKLAGHLACDSAQNGPYQFGALILRGAYTACQKCSEPELTIIDLLFRDSSSRIVGEEKWDPAPEGRR